MKTKRYILSSLAGILFSGSVLGANENFSIQNKSPFTSDGFYLGFELGIDSTNIQQSNIDISTNQDLNESGLLYGFYLGYQTKPLWNKFNAAVEIFAEGINNAKNTYTLTNPSNPSVFQKKNNLGFSLLPGYFINDSNKIYARLGLVESQFSYDHSFSANANYSNAIMGYQLGLGDVWQVWNHLGIRAEVDFTRYNQVHENQGLDNESTKYYSFDYKLGLQWSF